MVRYINTSTSKATSNRRKTIAPDRSHSLEDSNGFLFSFNELSWPFTNYLFPDLDSAKGLLVVTGGTSAGKSQITRGMRRLPHHLRQL